jgi:HK97 family phage major capsid protein
MEAHELRAAVAERQRAITAFREAQDEEPRQRAWAAAEEQRTIIDQATIDVAERLEKIEADEARARAEYVAAQKEVDPVWSSRSGFDRAIMDMVKARSGRLNVPSVDIKFPSEKRTDYPMTTTDTSAYGSYTIPTILWQDMVYHLNAQSAILQAGPTIIRTPGMNSLYVPVLLTDATATAGTESTAASNSTYPVFNRIELKAYREEGLMYITEEMERSSDYPMMQILNEVAGRALATKAASDYCLGAGSTAPDGLFIAAKADCGSNFETAGSTSTFTADELLAVMFNLHSGYRAAASWIVSQPAMQVIAGLKDGTGQYLLMPSVVAGVPDRLFGRPIYEDAHADANGAIATGEEHVIFGDMSKFWIRYAGNMVIEASRDFHFSEFETAVRFALWHDCNIVDVQAFAGLTQA